MPKKYVDVWKYPHMTYKKAFVIATIISIITVGVAFFSFSDYHSEKNDTEIRWQVRQQVKRAQPRDGHV